eukprot:4798973-Heterocapsa_arctica.AAC.1
MEAALVAAAVRAAIDGRAPRRTVAAVGAAVAAAVLRRSPASPVLLAEATGATVAAPDAAGGGDSDAAL